MDNKVYIVLSQTGTILSRGMRFFTHDEFNHVSIALDNTLNTMYSFGRLRPNLPFPAGFVIEGKDRGVYARFKDTRVCVLELSINTNQFELLEASIKRFLLDKSSYRYNYIGVIWAVFSKERFRYRHYYCSQFVKKVLLDSKIIDTSSYKKAMKPIDFLRLEGTKVVYKGLLVDYKEK